MKEILQRFTSRKFLLSLVAIVLVVAVPEHADSIVTLSTIFIGTEGAKDLAEAVRRNK